MDEKVVYDLIAMHEKPHLDEYVAIFLLKRFGGVKFPGISKAKISYLPNNKIPANSTDEYEKKGVIFVGIGGGRFDEHSTVKKDRKQNECAATLVAKALGIIENPSLEKILKFTLNNDLNAAAHPFDLAYLTKLMHQQYPENPEKVMEWVMMGLEIKYQEQFQFFNATKEEFERVAKIENVEGPNGRILRMATIISDNEQMSKFARSAYGGNVAIVIQKKLSGNVQIYTNRQDGLTLYDVAQMIRFSEQETKGKIITKDWKDLASEGKVNGAEEWFFHQVGQMLLNGSLTATNVPATQISLERIKEITKIGINPMKFFSRECEKRVCASKVGNECPWYKYGLQRCRKVRFEMKK